MSFTSSVPTPSIRSGSLRREHIEGKMECVDSMTSLLGSRDVDQLTKAFEAMSLSPDKCEVLRANRGIDMLVEVLHGEVRQASFLRQRASRTLHNIVHWKANKRESRVLKILEILRMYADYLRDVRMFASVDESGRMLLERGCGEVCIRLRPSREETAAFTVRFDDDDTGGEEFAVPAVNFVRLSDDGWEELDAETIAVKINIHQIIAVLTKCSHQDSHRQPISLLGGISALIELMQVKLFPSSNIHGLSIRFILRSTKWKVHFLLLLPSGNGFSDSTL